MKRIVCIFLVLILVLSGCGKTESQEQGQQRVTFYYAVKGTEQLIGDTAVDSESRNIQVFTLKQLLELYFQGPLEENMVSPFPDGTELLALSEGEDGLEVTLSGAFFTLQGIELTIASCCLVKTVCAYVNVDEIIVRDQMGRISLLLKPEDFLLENHFNQETDTSFTLYFADPDRRYLIAETREVTLSENESPEIYVLRQLLQGPSGDDLLPVIPENTMLLDVVTEEGTCTVDFSRAFSDERAENDYSNYLTIFSIVNTLTNLENITSVRFFVEGELLSEYGIFSLHEPCYRNGGAIGPVRANGTEVDVNVYVTRERGEQQFAVPVRVKLSISKPLTEAVVEAVIAYDPPQGFVNPIPYGTRLLSVSVSGSTCYVDLSREFVPTDGSEETERAAVWALVNALTDLDGISSVALTIEGEAAGLNYVDISEPLRKNNVSID